jgi:seryl-tRNA synthetase
MANKEDQNGQEVIGIKDEFSKLQERMEDIKYHNQRYLTDSTIELSGANFAEVLNATSAYSAAIRDTKAVIKDIYNYFSDLEVKVNKIHLKLAELHCDNVDNGLTETIEKTVEEDGK